MLSFKEIYLVKYPKKYRKSESQGFIILDRFHSIWLVVVLNFVAKFDFPLQHMVYILECIVGSWDGCFFDTGIRVNIYTPMNYQICAT